MAEKQNNKVLTKMHCVGSPRLNQLYYYSATYKISFDPKSSNQIKITEKEKSNKIILYFVIYNNNNNNNNNKKFYNTERSVIFTADLFIKVQ